MIEVDEARKRGFGAAAQRFDHAQIVRGGSSRQGLQAFGVTVDDGSVNCHLHPCNLFFSSAGRAAAPSAHRGLG